MIKNSLKISLFALLSTLLVCPISGFAANVTISSQFYADAGIQNYNEGKIAAAIHDFSKALMSDPGNATAQEYLNKMGVEREIYGRHVDPATEIAKLNQEMNVERIKRNELEEEHLATLEFCDELKNKNDELCRENKDQQAQLEKAQLALNIAHSERAGIEQRLQENNQIVEEYKAVADQHIHKNDTYSRVSDQHKNVIADQSVMLAAKDREIEVLNDRIQLVRRSTMNEIYDFEDMRLKQEAVFQKTVSHLRAKVHNLETSKKIIKDKSISKIRALQGALDEKEKELSVVGEKIALLKEKDQDIARLKERMSGMRDHIKKLELSEVPKTGKKYEELRGQLERAQGELQDRSLSLASKESDLRILQQRISDAKERLELVDEILYEKDNLINELSLELNELQAQCQPK